MNSLRGALNKDYRAIRPDALYNIPDQNRMGREMYRRFEKIVNEDPRYTAGAQRQSEIPYYYSIMGGRKDPGRAQTLEDIEPVIEAPTLRHSEIAPELLAMKGLSQEDLHLDENAQEAKNRIKRALFQYEYNTPGGGYPRFYFGKSKKIPYPKYPEDMTPELRRLLHQRAMAGGAWYDVFTKAFKKAGEILTETPLKYIPGVSTVGDIYKEIGKLGSGKRKKKGGLAIQPSMPKRTFKKHCSAFIYDPECQGGRKKRGGAVCGKYLKNFDCKKKTKVGRGYGLAGRVSNYPTIRT